MSGGNGRRPPALVPDKVRGLIFDLDGTLIDSYTAITTSLNHARARFELPALSVEAVRAEVGRGLEALVADLVGNDRVDSAVRLFRERYAQVFLDQTRILPGVADTLEQLARRGMRLAVASNKPARFTTPILEHLDLLRHFAAVEGPDSAGRTKPHPAMVRRCLDRLELGADNAVYVGDMVLDVLTATRSGLPVVLVPGGSSAEEALRRTGQPLVRAFPDLLNFFGNSR